MSENKDKLSPLRLRFNEAETYENSPALMTEDFELINHHIQQSSIDLKHYRSNVSKDKI